MIFIMFNTALWKKLRNIEKYLNFIKIHSKIIGFSETNFLFLLGNPNSYLFNL